jgi:hypothetical protein
MNSVKEKDRLARRSLRNPIRCFDQAATAADAFRSVGSNILWKNGKAVWQACLHHQKSSTPQGKIRDFFKIAGRREGM